MAGIELIVTALAAGAAAGLTNTTGGAIGDAYTLLKTLLRRRLAHHQDAVDALDAQETEPRLWQARLGEDLTGSGAGSDEEILAAARRLLNLANPNGAAAGKYQVDLREARGVQVGDHSIQHNDFS